MPVAGSEVYCNAANKNIDLVNAAEKKIRDDKEDIKKMELEIKQRKRDIKQQQRNCKAWFKLDETVPLETKPFNFLGPNSDRGYGYQGRGGRKSRRGKSRRRRTSRRR